MNVFIKILILYIMTVTILSPILYYTITWAMTGDEISASLSSLSFLVGVWIFHKTLGKIKMEQNQ